ncbi:MAG TPA: sugar transferase [Planctomycetaceae bacterium]|nr:sugar transferase [Blastopirellula sp.]HAY80137.1 sugar transferase [Planctomycetaceae bacterium]
MSDVLFLTHRVPYPPNRGDRIRSYHLLRYLAKRARVHLACLSDEPVPAETQQVLSQLCHRITYAQLHPQLRWLHGARSLLSGRTVTEGLFQARQLRKTVTAWSGDTSFDATLVFCSSMFQYLKTPALQQTPTVVDLVDVDSEKWFDYASGNRGLKRWLYHLEAKRVRRLEQTMANRAQALTVVSEDEAKLFRSFCPTDHMHAVGNGVDTDYFALQRTPSSEPQCVFVGVLDYYPNVDGVCWFCEEVWPAVRQAVPTARFSIVGRNPVQKLKDLERLDGVTVVGEVPDVRPHLATANVSIAPLLIARGVQNKVLEAMAAGTPVLASRQALTGLDLAPGVDALLAEDAPAWQRQLVDLLQNETLQSQLAARGRAFVQEHHSWERQLAAFSKLLNLPNASDTTSTGTTTADPHNTPSMSAS